MLEAVLQSASILLNVQSTVIIIIIIIIIITDSLHDIVSSLSLFFVCIIYLFICFFIYYNLNDSYFLFVFQLLSSLKLGTYFPVLTIPSFFILLCFLPLISLRLYSSLTCFLLVFTTSIIFLNICTRIMEL
jgi:hypothetical protein